MGLVTGLNNLVHGVSNKVNTAADNAKKSLQASETDKTKNGDLKGAIGDLGKEVAVDAGRNLFNMVAAPGQIGSDLLKKGVDLIS